MKDIEIVLENLALKGIKPDQSQQLFLETFIVLIFNYCVSSFMVIFWWRRIKMKHSF